MDRGIVKCFFEDKGYGFIERANGELRPLDDPRCAGYECSFSSSRDHDSASLNPFTCLKEAHSYGKQSGERRYDCARNAGAQNELLNQPQDAPRSNVLILNRLLSNLDTRENECDMDSVGAIFSQIAQVVGHCKPAGEPLLLIANDVPLYVDRPFRVDMFAEQIEKRVPHTTIKPQTPQLPLTRVKSRSIRTSTAGGGSTMR